MDLNEILIFAKVVDLGSFIRASEELGIPKSTVSRKISDLESRLGARLLQRTTRKLNLTDVGRTFHTHAERILAELEEATRAVTHLQAEPSGPLRLTIPVNVNFLAPIICSFAKQNPKVKLSINSTDAMVDIVRDGFDVGIRAGHLEDSSLISRRLFTLRSFLVASPRYLKKCEHITKPPDLRKADCLGFGPRITRNHWTLTRGKKPVTVSVTPRFSINNFHHLNQAAREGLGIAMLPEHVCTDDLKRKRLQRVLPKWCSEDIPVNAVYPSKRHLSPKVKALIDHMQETLSPLPWTAQ